MRGTEETAERQALYERLLRENPRLYRPARDLSRPAGDPAAVVFRYVLAPALGAFTRWLLEETEQAGIRRLYFLARDGYFFCEAARILAEAYRLPVECRYLSCSRYSLRLPLFHLNRQAALNAVCRGGLRVTPGRILRRAGLTAEERTETLRLLALPWAEGEMVPYARLGDVRRRLEKCGYFLACMDRHSRQALPGLAGYLRQEGLLDGAPDAVVDSGWTGTIQQTMGEALAYLGRTAGLTGYYWGLYELPDGVRRADYHSYYFAPEGDLRQKAGFNNNLFEAVYTAPHGMTLGYRRDGETYAPVYGALSASRRAFVERTGTYLTAYVRKLAQEGRVPFSPREDRATIRRLFDAFMGAPTPEEALVFGSLPFSDDVLEGEETPLAAPLSEAELRSGHAVPRLLSMAGLRAAPARESAWYEGSAVRGGRHVRRHLRQNKLYQYLRHGRKIRRARRRKEEAP